jgi:hypothetical protein
MNRQRISAKIRRILRLITFPRGMVDLLEEEDAARALPDGAVRYTKLSNIYMRMSNGYAIRVTHGNDRPMDSSLANIYHELSKSYRELVYAT